ncbi:anti-sigma factor [Allobranchiibius sp. GilTou38]|uniref:zf-HC2 domain-containing protein n=1 Tax=Allobranchiibius sp. GilTou38 TaxID=2815210 RepID=UPI001AA1AEEA|nr:anti-sigma factor [Allobranchiibius sp. GilTou38]MBO1766520.1 zf-HC2 domain-containing protein [Allobranchiibius sp. GilTou38]
MTGWSYDPVRADLAAYALGALEPADEMAVRDHLPTCEECRAELAEFSAIVPRLAAVADSDLTLPRPPAALFDRVAAAVDATEQDGTQEPPASGPTWRERALRGGRRRLIAVAAVLALLVAGGAALTAQRLNQPDTVNAVATSGAVTMHVRATGVASGTTLRISVDGIPQNVQCHLVVTKDDGSRHSAGWWSSGYSGHAVYTSSTDVPRRHLAVLTLYGADGESLVSLRM